MVRKVDNSRFKRLCVVPLLCLLLLVPLLPAFPVSAEDLVADVDLRFDYEQFQSGPLNGQQGWAAVGDEVAVTTDSAKSGTQSVQFNDYDETAVNTYYRYPTLTEGKIEWWAKTDSINRMVAQIQQTAGGTKTAEWIGFNSDGRFVYYDGDTRKSTAQTYQPGTWYRFSVEFDTATETKTIMISDDQGPVFREEGIAFWNTGMTGVDMIRFSTISTATGLYHIDDVRIASNTEENMEELVRLDILPRQMQLIAGQTAVPQLIGYFSHGGIQQLEGDEGILLVSDNPSVAPIEDNTTIRAVAKGEAAVTVTYDVYSAVTDVTVYGEDETPPYKRIEPRTLQRETDLSGLTIITPEDPQWKQAGEEIALKLNQLWAIEATVMESDENSVGNGWGGNTLVIGNLGNNSHIARLYGLYLAYSDAIHPGAGGYQLQTIIDPFGMGGNTILLGVSDEDGLEEGIGRFGELLDGLAVPELPWLSESVLSDEAIAKVTYGINLTQERIQTLIDSLDAIIARLNPDSSDELEANHLLSLFERTMFYGKWYQITNDEGYGQVYKHALKAYAHFLNSYPDIAKAQLSSSRNMWTSGFASIGTYTVMEPSPLFSEEEREQIISALYLTYETNAKDRYLLRAPAQGPRNNHDAYPALSMIFGASYFQKYHEFPESDDWYALGERIFTGNTTNINIDEGSDYLLHVPTLTLDYAMATGDRQFLGLRPSADLKAMMIDNLGTVSSGGDSYPFGYSSAYSWNHSQVLNAATWFFGDPMYQFLLERTRTGPFDGQRMPDLNNPFHRYTTLFESTELPESIPMVQSYPIEQGLYDMLVDEMGESVNVDVEDTFHKLAFRKGFNLSDDYLMLDGFSAGRHGHLDGNTIIKYSANGRIFIDDKEYIEKAPKNHTGILVIKDGEQFNKPPLTKLEWAADAGGIGVSRSTVPGYNGTDWTRSIVSPGGDFFLIYDDIEFNEAGNYVLENTWQTLGELTATDDRYIVEQQGATMTVQSLDDSDLRSYERYEHFQKYWKWTYPYPYADAEHVLRQVKGEQAFAAGDKTGFINVLSSSTNGDNQIRASIVDSSTILIEEGIKEWYAAWSVDETDSLESDAAFILFGEEEVLLADVTSVRLGSETLQFNEPVLLNYRESDGHWEAFRLTKGMNRYDENGEPIQDGTIAQGYVEANLSLIEDVRAVGEAPVKTPKTGLDFTRGWTEQVDFSEQITASTLADLDGDGTEELLIGGVSGKVHAYAADGTLVWIFQAAGRVNEVTVESVQGDSLVLIATENWYVHVLDGSGLENWNVEIPNTSAHRELKGNLLGITNARIAYMNGSTEEPWIMVGTQFRYLYGFDLQGNQQYEDIVYFYGIEDMAFADLDGDGKDEGVIATEYYNYAILDNGILTRYGGSTGPGPGYKVIEPIYNWGPAGETAVAYGTKLNWVNLIQYSGVRPTEVWSRNVGGEVNAIVSGDFDGDGQIEIAVASDGFYLHLLNGDGTIRWKAYLGNRVMSVEPQSTLQGTVYIATTDNGGVIYLDDAGQKLDAYRFDGLVQAIHAEAQSQDAWVVLDSGKVYRSNP